MLVFDAGWLPPNKEKTSKLAKKGKQETIIFECLNPVQGSEVALITITCPVLPFYKQL